jgi:hypothetical protein
LRARLAGVEAERHAAVARAEQVAHAREPITFASRRRLKFSKPARPLTLPVSRRQQARKVLEEASTFVLDVFFWRASASAPPPA